MASKKRYSREFKIRAVAYWEQSNKTSDAIAEELGIRGDQLRHWKTNLSRDKDLAFPGEGNPRDVEMYMLKKKIAELKEENEILKKATAIFSKVKP